MTPPLVQEGVLPLEPPAGISERAAWMDYLEMTKPRLSAMVGLTAAGGYFLGAAGPLEGAGFATAVAGVFLLSAGACAVNQVQERDHDALMDRTRERPVAAGRLAPLPGLLFGLALCLAGAAVLALGSHPVAAHLGLLCFVLYVFAYTPLKRSTSLCTGVGAVSGALPPVIGWAAATGEAPLGAWVLFGLMFLWQHPHFLAIAWMRRDDYERAGFQMLTVVDPTGRMAGRQAVAYAMALVPVSLLPTLVGTAGPVYYVSALVLGVLYAGRSVQLALSRSDAAAQRLFIASLIYLPLIFSVLMLDKVAT